MPQTPARQQFQDELAQLEIQTLGALDMVCQALDRALEVVAHQDVELASMVIADDDRSGSTRTFRIDRIETVEATGEVVPARDAELPEPGTWFADGSVPRAVFRIGPAARWAIERYPVDSIGEVDADGWVTVRLAVASEQWLARLLLRLGPHAEVVEPEEWADLGRQAAARVLARYRAASDRS